MARNTFLSWSTTASENTDVGGVFIGENCPPSNLNDADRMTMAILRRDLDNGMVYSAKSGAYTATASDNNAVLRFTATATLSLTAAATLGANWHVKVIADGGDVTIDPDASEKINDSNTLVLRDGFASDIICTGSAFFTDKALSSLSTLMKWRSRGIGELYFADTSIVGVDIPPSTTIDTVWIELTSGLTGSGGFNENKLSSESVSGSGPTLLASAVIDFAGSPINGKTVRLLNSEARMLRPSTSPGTLQSDQFQGHFFGTASGTLGDFNLNVSSGSTVVGAMRADSLPRAVPRDDGTNGTPRTGNETRVKNLGVKTYMRIA
ncbi:hypothetical protein [Rhizobium sp. KDH_Rht_773_N]